MTISAAYKINRPYARRRCIRFCPRHWCRKVMVCYVLTIRDPLMRPGTKLFEETRLLMKISPQRRLVSLCRCGTKTAERDTD